MEDPGQRGTCSVMFVKNISVYTINKHGGQWGMQTVKKGAGNLLASFCEWNTELVTLKISGIDSYHCNV
jgi:hypothetical protein